MTNRTGINAAGRWVSNYMRHIMEALGATAGEAEAVEQFMRDEHGTLDGLSRAHFTRHARSCLRDVRAYIATPALWADGLVACGMDRQAADAEAQAFVARVTT